MKAVWKEKKLKPELITNKILLTLIFFSNYTTIHKSMDFNAVFIVRFMNE